MPVCERTFELSSAAAGISSTPVRAVLVVAPVLTGHWLTQGSAVRSAVGARGRCHLIPSPAASSAALTCSRSRARYRVERPMPRWRAIAVAALATGAGDGQHIIVDSRGPAAAAALGLGGAQAVEGPLADQVAFHLRGHRGDHEQHLVGDGGPVGSVPPGTDAREEGHGGTAG